MIVIASPWFLIVGIPVLVVYIAIQVIFVLSNKTFFLWILTDLSLFFVAFLCRNFTSVEATRVSDSITDLLSLPGECDGCVHH